MDTKSTERSILIFGILSLALGVLYGMPVPALILAIIGKNKHKNYEILGNYGSKEAEIGKICCEVGFWLSIITIAIEVLIFMAACIYAVCAMLMMMTMAL